MRENKTNNNKIWIEAHHTYFERWKQTIQRLSQFCLERWQFDGTVANVAVFISRWQPAKIWAFVILVGNDAFKILQFKWPPAKRSWSHFLPFLVGLHSGDFHLETWTAKTMLAPPQTPRNFLSVSGATTNYLKLVHKRTLTYQVHLSSNVPSTSILAPKPCGSPSAFIVRGETSQNTRHRIL